jgi:hypothetical protein
MQENDSTAIEWGKNDVIHFLSRLKGYRTYLELCTPTTGGFYHTIDRTQFSTCHRLMYRCPPDYDDNLPIDFRTPDLQIGQLMEAMHSQALRYDMVLVDSYHIYDTTYRDIADALSLITDRGALLVHDCLPPSEDLVSLEMMPGSWCGASFIAFIDFVQNVRGIEYATVDTDYGCGLIRKSNVVQPALASDIRSSWESLRHDIKAAHRFMLENKGPLLHALSVEEFKNFESMRAAADAAPA